MVLILAKARSCNPKNDPITPSLFFFWVCDYGFFSFISIWQLLDGRWSTGRSDVHGSGQNHHGSWYEEAQAPHRDYRRQVKTIDLSKPHSMGSLIKQVHVISLLDDIFGDLDCVFSSNLQSAC